jgi:hypothetical protein
LGARQPLIFIQVKPQAELAHSKEAAISEKHQVLIWGNYLERRLIKDIRLN